MKWLLIDLDCTLYPPENTIFLSMGLRITDYIQTILNISRTEATTLRDRYWKEYGLTLIGLIRNHSIHSEDFLHYVHDVDIEKNIQPNPELAKKLSEIPIKKVLFTNSCRYYARKVLSVLGLAHCFESPIIDIRQMQFFPKPHPKAYEIVMNHFQCTGNQCIMIDDSQKNLQTARSFGMQTIWVGKGKCSESINGHACGPDEIVDQIWRLIDKKYRS
jgi:putative hydrolase of the HAD superfamily